ncbi:hypothetical protein BDV97DRAFT_395393 [Delphinella strobiligena]|nr:hypothetical protein BDV97DRAFT_395393 [Delphinella strobiligena]
MSMPRNLSVPVLSSRRTTSRSNSASAVQRSVESVDTMQDASSQARLRADSSQSKEHGSVQNVTEEPQRPSRIELPTQKVENAGDLHAGLASPMMPDGAVQTLISSIHAENPGQKAPSASELQQTTFFAGPSQKPFKAHNHLLLHKVPYFRKLLSSKTPPTKEQLTFANLDEFGAAIFVRWLYGGKLHGPTDFHSMHHYLGLYVLAFTWDVEDLCNNVMDLVRAYYRHTAMTAPAFRLEYIYTMTSLPNKMRSFLTQTAAYRAICESPPAPGVYLSESIQGVVRKSADLAVDLAEALIKLSRNDATDPRKGEDCQWHDHSDGKICKPTATEPFE